MNEKKAIQRAICKYVVMNLYERLTDKHFYALVKFVDGKTIRQIPDTVFLKNDRLKKYIDYSLLDRKQVIRLMTRDVSILDYIKFDVMNFKVNELEMFIANRPNYTRLFNFDLNTLTGKEIIILLKADLNYLNEIDFKNKKFTSLDFHEMIKYFADIPEIVEKIDFNAMDNFTIRHLLIHTKEKYINRIDLNKLNWLDWIEILKTQPQLFKYCDISLFESGDGFKLAQLACVVPEVDYLIEKNIRNVTALAWEKLLIHDTEKYLSMCDFSLFKEVNWKNVLRKKPYLIKYKI